jgi:epoxyqueuosine reductase
MNRSVPSDLEARARELGFDAVGISPTLSLPRGEFFRTWLAEGKSGTMAYLGRTAKRRLDPQLVLPGARSIVSVAQSYFTGSLPETMRNDPSRGWIASYAWGRDYHDVMLPKLEELAKFIRDRMPAAETRCYVDTGPILERDYAERAGLGFIGKNTLLISPRAGSWLFLGEIITTAELSPTPPAQMPSCGSCRRCIEACPTGAISPEYVLDANLCISYLTIEYRGTIPQELRAKMGNRVFGCDACQSCCPWNERFARPTGEQAYYGNIERQAPKLEDLAALSEEEFRKRFAGSAVLRAGHAGFLRNMAVALENWKSNERS